MTSDQTTPTRQRQPPRARVNVPRIPRRADARAEAQWEAQEAGILDMLSPYHRRALLREVGRSLLGLLEAVVFILATGVAVGIAVHIATH